MLKPRLPDVEAERLKELFRLEVLDTEAESEFNEIVTLASYITGCPISLISLIDSDRQWFKAKVGLTAAETHRDISFCGHAILGDQLFEIENATLDERFSDNPLVAGNPNIRFYAGQPLVTSQGFKIGTLCAIDDVPKKLSSEQRQALADLAKHTVHILEIRLAKRKSDSERTLAQAILDCTAEAVWGLATDGSISFINKKGLEIFGYTHENQVVGQNSHTLFHHSRENGTFFPKEECAIFHALPAGRAVHLENDVFWKADGSSFHGEYRSKPLIVSGELRGAVVSLFDITEKVQADKELELSQMQFKTLVNSIPQLAWMTDSSGSIYWYNKNWYSYTGTTLEEMQGWGWQSVQHPDHLQEVMERWPACIKSGEPFEMEFPLRGKDGQYRWFLTRAVPAKDSEGNITHWIGTNTDVEGQRQIIKNLEDERALREKFVATLTHDLRTPISAGKFTSQLLMRKNHSPEFVTKYALRIDASLSRADRMIQDLLDATRLKAGQGIPLTKKEAKLDQIVKWVVDEYAENRGTRFVLNCVDTQVSGFWDADGIQRMLENLLNNAEKYGSADSLVTTRITETTDWVELAVHNQGDPIEISDQKTLFDPFSRTGPAQTSGLKGWGIGLSLVQGIAEAHGGTVRVTSDLDHGTTFTIQLPRDARKTARDFSKNDS